MKKSERERLEHGLKVLDAWANAIRGDWGSIDGRQSQSELWAIGGYLSGERETLTFGDAGVCKDGHWIDHCEPEECWFQCDRRDYDGAPCGYPVHPMTERCKVGHE